MEQRSYGQFCGLAFALDAVGERWTLLIIRELLTGPKRFTDIEKGLPGISTNLLSERLKGLEQLGVIIRRTLPPPYGSTVYALTPMGQALEAAVLELGKWGAHLFPPSPEGLHLPSLGSISLAIRAFFHPEHAQDMDETYELRFGEEALQVRVEQGGLKVRQGKAQQPAAVIHTDMPSFLSLFTGQVEAEEALASGLVHVEGDPTALGRFLKLTGPRRG